MKSTKEFSGIFTFCFPAPAFSRWFPAIAAVYIAMVSQVAMAFPHPASHLSDVRDDIYFPQIHLQTYQCNSGPCLHMGYDIAYGASGASLYAGASGKIVGLWKDEPDQYWYGNSMEIELADGTAMLFAHMDTFGNSPDGDIWKVGDSVTPDSVIGTLGSTDATAAHLHVEYRAFPFSVANSAAGSHPFHPGSDGCQSKAYQPKPSDIRQVPDCVLEDWVDNLDPTLGQFPDHGEKPGFYANQASTELKPGLLRNLYLLAVDAYSKIGTDNEYPGLPYDHGSGTEAMHCWSWYGNECINGNGVFIQDLHSPYRQVHHGHSAIILNTINERVYPLSRGFYNAYTNHDGFFNFGEPESEELIKGQLDVADRRHYEVTYQQFAKHILVWSPEFDVSGDPDDGISVFDKTWEPISAVRGLGIEFTSGVRARVFLNGKELCTTPCSSNYFYRGFTYRLEIPDLKMSEVYIESRFQSSMIELIDKALSWFMPDAMANDTKANAELLDAHTLVFTADDDISVVIKPSIVAQTLVGGPDRNHDAKVDLVVPAGSERNYFQIEYHSTSNTEIRIQDAASDQNIIAGILGDPKYRIKKRQSFDFFPVSSTDSRISTNFLVNSSTNCGSVFINEGASAYKDSSGSISRRLKKKKVAAYPVQTHEPLCLAVIPGFEAIDYSGQGDADGDGLTDYSEACSFGTSPCQLDTDGDGESDAVELANGFDPLEWNDYRANVLFKDDFNDDSIDVGLWEVNSGSTVREESGELRIDVEVTDSHPSIWTKSITIDPMKSFVISRKANVYAANDKYNGLLEIEIDGYPDHRFGISYANYNYSNSRECETYGFSIWWNDANPHFCADQNVRTSALIEGVWDEWFEEEIHIDPVAGNLSYFIDGVLMIEAEIGLFPPGADTLTVQLSAWGWWTAHRHYTDDFMFVQ